MENKFKQVMSERTDEELIKIVAVERNRYEPLAVEAAEAEIEKRNIDTSDFEQIREKATVEKEQKEKVDSNVVGSGIRFVNFIIDIIAWIALTFIISFIIGFFVPVTTENEGFLTFFAYALFIGTFVAYYAIMEIKFQKTIGKFVTKTKVVKMNGERPTDGDIIARSFCRLIPFDRLSFLFVKNGIHDFLSKTKVVKDSKE